MAEPKLRRMSEAEFLAWQEKQDQLYELVDGFPVLHVKMMTGASQAHDRITVNIIASLHRQLRGGACRPTTDDLAVRMPSGNVRRPDVTVECGAADRREQTVSEPRVVVEVLSPSTMSFDRIRKLPEYQMVATLMHIVLVDTEAPRIDLYSRTPDGNWQRFPHSGLHGSVALSAIGATLALADVFEGVEFPNETGGRAD